MSGTSRSPCSSASSKPCSREMRGPAPLTSTLSSRIVRLAREADAPLPAGRKRSERGSAPAAWCAERRRPGVLPRLRWRRSLARKTRACRRAHHGRRRPRLVRRAGDCSRHSRAVIRPPVAAETVEASANATSTATATRNILAPTPAPSLRFRRYQSGSPFVPEAARVRYRGPPPSARIVSTCPPRWNEMRQPSGDHAGSSALRGVPVAWGAADDDCPRRRSRFARRSQTRCAGRPAPSRVRSSPCRRSACARASWRGSSPRSGSGRPRSSETRGACCRGTGRVELVRDRRPHERHGPAAARRDDPEVEVRRRRTPEDDPPPVGRPRRRLAVAGARGQPARGPSIGVHHPDARLADDAAGERDPLAVGRPRRLLSAADKQPSTLSRREDRVQLRRPCRSGEANRPVDDPWLRRPPRRPQSRQCRGCSEPGNRSRDHPPHKVNSRRHLLRIPVMTCYEIGTGDVRFAA